MVPRFPYVVVFVNYADSVEVPTIFRTSREPAGWRRRVRWSDHSKAKKARQSVNFNGPPKGWWGWANAHRTAALDPQVPHSSGSDREDFHFRGWGRPEHGLGNAEVAKDLPRGCRDFLGQSHPNILSA